MTVGRQLWDRIRPHWKAIVGAIICVLVVGGVELALPLFFGRGIVDEILLEQENIAKLTLFAAAGIVLVLLRGVFTYGRMYLMAYVGQKIVLELRRDLFEHLLDLPLGFHSRRKSGELISRVTNDVGVIQNMIVSGVTDLLQQMLMITGIMILIFYLNWELALISIISLPAAGFAISAYGNRIRSYSKRLQEKLADLTAILGETLSGIRVIKAFTMESCLRKVFSAENKRSFTVSMKSVQAIATVTPVVDLIVVTGIMVVIWFGGRAVLAGEFTMGGLISFLTYLGMATRPLGLLTKSYSLLQQAVAASERIFEMLNTPDRLVRVANTRMLCCPKGRVEFEEVSFAYDGHCRVLNGISFAVEPGEVVALVGPSGAGKTTLANLIPRFYDPGAGRILLDGEDIRNIDLTSLRKQIGLVPQDPVLFSTSIANNISAFSPGADRDDVIRAAKMANAHDFIEEMPEGYDTVVGERGARLSGGQRQRVAIARAIFRDPRILILDEATSALDAESEALIQEALVRLQKDRTTFIIAHRLSTIKNASKIIVLDGGRVVESGTHAELLAGGRLYPRLYNRQIQKDVQPLRDEGKAGEDPGLSQGRTA